MDGIRALMLKPRKQKHTSDEREQNWRVLLCDQDSVNDTQTAACSGIKRGERARDNGRVSARMRAGN
jgi:hypothetical protein